jgi:NAD(P)-dependent dehydrogenase (short-subunit alcohol dehydrogenase family)
MTELALVTGGARNIGLAIARRLRADGYGIVILDIEEPEDPDVGEFLRVDLADPEATGAELEQLARNRAITRLVNNVGIVRPAFLDKTTLAEFDKVLATNARSAFQVTQALLPAMRAARFGRVVSIASRVVLGKPERTAYSASKGAIAAMTRTWALELAPMGITVNAVAPGTIGTSAFFENNRPDDPRTRAIIAAIPAGRIGTPDDVANVVSFFLDARSSFVTGQMLYVCGGLTVGLAYP